MNEARSIQLFQILNQSSTIIIGILLAQTIAPELIGAYEVLLLLSLFIGTFIFQGLIQTFLSQIEKGDYSKSAYLFNFFLLTISILWPVLLIIYFFRIPLGAFLSEDFRDDWLPELLIYAGTILPSYILAYWLMIKKRFKMIIYFGLLQFLLRIIAFYLPINFGYGLDTVFTVLMYTGILVFTISFIAIIQDMEFIWDSNIFRKLGWVSLSLIVYGVIGILPQYADAIIVNHFYGDNYIYAIFRYGTKEIPFVGALTAGVSSAALPLLSKVPTEGMDFLKLETEKLIRWLFPVALFIILLAPFLFPIVYTEAFEFSGFLFSLLLISLIPRILFAQTVCMYLGKTRLLIIVAILELVLNIGLSLWLVQYLGLIGVLLATVVAYFFEKAILATYLLNYQGIRLKDYAPLRLITFFFLGCVVVWIVEFIILNPTVI